MTEEQPKKKIPIRGRETEHLKGLRLSCEQYRAWFYKIPDMPFRAQNPKPFDAFLNAFGAAIAIEAKYRNEPCRFGMSDLSTGQRENLEKFQLGGGVAVAVLFHHVKGSAPRMYWFSWAELVSSRYAIEPTLRSVEARRVRVQKTAKTGKVRFDYEWSYEVWDFLKWCTDEWVKNFRSKLLEEPGSGAALGLARSFRFGLPAFEVHPRRPD